MLSLVTFCCVILNENKIRTNLWFYWNRCKQVQNVWSLNRFPLFFSRLVGRHQSYWNTVSETLKKAFRVFYNINNTEVQKYNLCQLLKWKSCQLFSIYFVILFSVALRIQCDLLILRWTENSQSLVHGLHARDKEMNLILTKHSNI